jgi:di/tricarboxylate transporter
MVGLWLLSGALAVVCGSLLKIAPFISWLELQQTQIAHQRLDVKLPRVRQLLPDRTANRLLGLFLAVVALLLLGGLFRGEFARASGVALIAFALLFGVALVNLERTRRATRGRFSMAATSSR